MRAIYALNALDWMWTINYIECKSSSSFWHGSDVACHSFTTWDALKLVWMLYFVFKCALYSLSLSLLLAFFFLSAYVWVRMSVSWILVLILAGIPESFHICIHVECAIRRYVFQLFNLTSHVWAFFHTLSLSLSVSSLV